MCFEGVKVEKELGLRLPPNLRWKMFAAFVVRLNFFVKKRVTMKKRGRPFGHFKLQMALAQLCKITSPYLCKHPNTSTAKGKN